MKKIALSAMLAAACAAAPCAHGRDFRVRDFGARGDGATLDTQAIQAALDAAAKAGGGTVVLTPGKYRSGSIFVKSGTTLEIQAGATLLGSERLADYPRMPTRVAGIEMIWPAALVNVVEQHAVRIEGAGTIDGDGKVFWESFWKRKADYQPRGLRWAADYDAPRPRLIQIFQSSNVTLAGPLLTRSGFWTVHICYSDHVHVDGVTIRNNVDGRGPSTDGIDIDSSRHVLVEHADISANDDALCLKAGRDADGLRVNRPDEDIVVRDSIVREGAAAFTIGSETSGGFRNVEAYNIRALAGVPSGILIKSAHTRGGWAENIRIHDLQLDGVAIPIHIVMDWNPQYSYARIPPGMTNVPSYWKVLATPVPRSQGLAHFRKVRIWNIAATGARRAFDVSASPEAPLENFSLEHIAISAQSAGAVADAKGWSLAHVSIRAADGSRLTFTDTEGLRQHDDTGTGSGGAGANP
jgi:polygalacturonase